MTRIAIVVIKAGNKTSASLSFKTNITDLKRDDIVLVDTIYGAQIAKFIRYGDSTDFPPTKWIIEKIDYSEKLKLLEGGTEI